MKPWYKVVTPRAEVMEGRSFNPDEFAIALEQVVDGTAPQDYVDPGLFFSRTYLTHALKEHTSVVLRRLSGETENAPGVLTLITQFGGGKTHTLTALYHIARSGPDAAGFSGMAGLLADKGLATCPTARVGVFVGNAWDPSNGVEAPWIDLAHQLAGKKGVDALGASARAAPPGTAALGRLFDSADAPVLLLFDEVLNFVNRHDDRTAEHFLAFMQNLTVAVSGTTRVAAVISLPRSQVEMTGRDQQWQAKITKVVHRVAKDLIANDESEISEVVRRRLFEDLGDPAVHQRVAKVYADWCLENSARLPSEWLAVDTAKTEAKAREFLRSRFATCYPFHPATLSVFQRKWRALPQFQQTRGALSMFAQWISWVARRHFEEARTEGLITLGSAPLDKRDFRTAVLGQLGQPLLGVAIDTDIAGERAHARALDVGTKEALRDIHRRVGATIFFESSGGQVDKTAHLPELRFALGEPGIDTATIDNAANALVKRGFFIRGAGSDGYRIHHQATLTKVANDRRASLDETGEVFRAIRDLVKKEFNAGARPPFTFFPKGSSALPDVPRLTLVVIDPEAAWEGETIESVGDWTRHRGGSDRLYPGALIWCAKMPGRELQDKIEWWLAWKRVAHELAAGDLGEEYGSADHEEVSNQLASAAQAAKDAVWASYRYVALFDRDSKENDLNVIDLGTGHSGSTFSGRIIGALTDEGLLSETISAGYIERNWPHALLASGCWELVALRKSFLDGSLTRLIDPEAILRQQIVAFVHRKDFGLASGKKEDGFTRVWYGESVSPEEVTFESGVFLLTRAAAEQFKQESPSEGPDPTPLPPADPPPPPSSEPEALHTLRLTGPVPPEMWNRLGIKLLPRLQTGTGLGVRVEFEVHVPGSQAMNLKNDVEKILAELELKDRLIVTLSTKGP